MREDVQNLRQSLRVESFTQRVRAIFRELEISVVRILRCGRSRPETALHLRMQATLD